MKIAQIDNNFVRYITPYKSWEEVPPFASNIVLVEAPDEVQEGWYYIDDEFTAPIIPEPEPIEHQPTNAELAQQTSELYARLIIAGVI